MIKVVEHRVFYNGGWIDIGMLETPSFILYSTQPTAANSGADEGLITGLYTGPTTITTPTTLNNLELPNKIILQAPLNLNNCLVSAVSTASQQYMIDTRHANANLSAFRCTFRPSTMNYYNNSVYGGRAKLDRCLIEKVVDGTSVVGDDYEVRACLIRDLSWFDTDGGIHGLPILGTHNDGQQGHMGYRTRFHGNTVQGYKYNVLNPTNNPAGTTPLDQSAENRYPQIGQITLYQHGVGWFPGDYTASEDDLGFLADGSPDWTNWGGAPVVYGNWITGGDGGIKFSSIVSFGAQDGQLVDIAGWVVNNTWLDYPRVYTSNPYPIRIDTNTILNGQKWPATTGQGWTDLTTPMFDFGNRYSSDASIPSGRRGHSVGVRVDQAAASVARI